MTAHRLEARNVSKTFGAIKVLDAVDLVVEPGEIHALIGQNGSGKSTLVKILTGYHSPDPGMSFALDGSSMELPVQRDALADRGVGVVHQDLGLLDHASVAENIGVGGFLCSKVTRRIDWARQNDIARQVLERVGVDVDPSVRVEHLNATERAEVGIARALRDHTPGGGVIILDEATRSFPRAELARFHGLLKRVVAEGTSVIFVTHSLEEVRELSDRVTVLRDGVVVGAGLITADMAELDLARLMIGRSLRDAQTRSGDPTELTWSARVRKLVNSPGRPSLDFVVGQGEIVGITGLPDGGYSEIPYAITGARRPLSGTLETPEVSMDLTRSRVADSINAGVALVPERRDRDGLVMEMSLLDNLALPSIRRRGRPWYVGRGWQREVADRSVALLSIKTPSTDTLVKELSGGNQQNVLFAKWLMM